MNKLCVTKQGQQWFKEGQHNEEQELLDKSRASLSHSHKRSSSLPQLLSTARITEKQELEGQLCRMTLRLGQLKKKGLQNMMIEKEDEHLRKKLVQQFSGRKGYIRDRISDIIRKTRDNRRSGNIQSRLQRGKAYANRLEYDFEKRFTFRPPKPKEHDE